MTAFYIDSRVKDSVLSSAHSAVFHHAGKQLILSKPLLKYSQCTCQTKERGQDPFSRAPRRVLGPGGVHKATRRESCEDFETNKVSGVRCGPGRDAEKAISGNQLSLCTILCTGLYETSQMQPHRSRGRSGFRALKNPCRDWPASTAL